ncbi:Murein DD-endopeptidase MepH precursor [Pseudodesulfovibrio hydrargyri]|uniref:Murein DD-endopeptidase MepH n=1 Tax=Pseudodesulfovibrio hydrargyri TaxID=2125990 RepID=A0A1J5NBD2_9BACT|nr:C40 family peptidase [Pseudodesulfovibrio hydrargyri]OIQ50535.1 Murein DD-endopeptidase MepH precursor [Pseudodesulfovibrio hydrargyri]
MRHRTSGRLPALGLAACALLLCACAATSPVQPPPPEISARPAPAAPKAVKVIRLARSLVGTPYKWGGYSPKTGFDCSGFIWYVYHQNGVDLPRLSWQQLGSGRPVQRADIRPGDLVFHQVDKNGKSLHVGIVTERGTFVHSPSSGSRVMESSLNSPFWEEHYLSARRVL